MAGLTVPAVARASCLAAGSLVGEDCVYVDTAGTDAQDIRYALRVVAARPLFTATAALSLALGDRRRGRYTNSSAPIPFKIT